MNKILLRRATVEDARAIFEVTKSAFELYADAVGRRDCIGALGESVQDVIEDIKTKYVYVCDMDGEVTGAVRFEILEAGVCYLSRFATNPKRQNLGIGGLLIEKVLHECRGMDVNAIVLYTASKLNSTVSFYISNGYHIHAVDKRADYIRLLMVLELTDVKQLFDYEEVLHKFGY